MSRKLRLSRKAAQKKYDVPASFFADEDKALAQEEETGEGSQEEEEATDPQMEAMVAEAREKAMEKAMDHRRAMQKEAQRKKRLRVQALEIQNSLLNRIASSR